MLSTSMEYIQALRTGDYLRFLEWPYFLVQQYTCEGEVVDADETLGLIIFEWLNNGFGELDMEHMVVLAAVYELKPEIIQSGLAYSYTSLYIATIHCMIYLKYQPKSCYLCQDKLTKMEVVQLIHKNMQSLASDDFDVMEQLARNQFLKLVSVQDKSIVAKAAMSINSIAHLRYLIDDYYTSLEMIQNPVDQLKQTRLSVLMSFAHYLNGESQLTEEVKNSIREYVKKLWELQPERFEEDYLNSLYPPSFVENAWAIITDYGLQFFNRLKESKMLSIKSEPSQDFKP